MSELKSIDERRRELQSTEDDPYLAFRMESAHNYDFEALEKEGWEVHSWGDAAVMSPYFQVLRIGNHQDGYEYMIYCPTFLRRPLILGKYGGGY